jgi:ribonuclease HII
MDMQIARAEAQLIVSGIEGATARMRKLEDSKSLTEGERESLDQTIAASEHALALARELFGSSGFSK